MASFIMAGRYQAIAFISLFALLSLAIPPFVFFSNAAVALIALRQGTNQGIIVTLIASVALAIATTFLQQDFLLGFSSGLQQWLPMVLFAILLTRSVSWTYTLQAMLLIVVGGLILFHLSVSDTQAFWKEPVEQLVEVFAQSQQWSAEESDKFIEMLSTWAAAIIAVSLLISWILSLFIARHWQATLYHSGGFGKEFRELRIGKIPAFTLLIIVVLFAATENQMVSDIAVVGMSVFLFQGLGLVHGLVKKMQMSHIWLIGMYILLIPILPSSMVIMILLVSFGIIDNFVDFRNTLTKKS